MHIRDILNTHSTSFSFEFFPPKDEKASDRLFKTINDLIQLKPLYVSVTYGAGGSTRELTQNLVMRLTRETRLTVAAHLTCVCSTRLEIKGILENYVKNGIENIMALGGDMPKNGICPVIPASEGFERAPDLVAFIKKNFPSLGIGVAGFPEGHPRIPNRLKEIDYLKSKVDAGADYICTQLFFDNHLFFDFCERCVLAGINVPVIAGIMPVTSLKGMQRMAELSACTHFPARLLKAMARAEDESHVEKVGIHWAAEQVSDLVDKGVKGIHFYTLNQSDATLRIYDSLGLTNSDRLSI
ncbi:MAG TPA: methylenetetrahydrofolate reductase [NAD(P)H] [Fibrobacteres bacterium]|jgi:methylenetetrahydrofolate reductase (NADPH)|nr:methylenetetrahydrofolate reductase [NAD(P)H] [Fibrobacterota bacterium]